MLRGLSRQQKVRQVIREIIKGNTNICKEVFVNFEMY